MKKLLLLLSISLFCISANAEQITESQAAEIAKKYMPQLSSRKSALKAITNSAKANVADYYVFNAGNDKGFVIVSGDDSLTELIGYSDSGSFSTDNMPDNLKNWLATYSEYVESVRSGEAAKIKKQVKASATPVVDAFVESKWNQGYPYSLLCPYVTTYRDYCPTGCVATAMAQIFYYHKWPEQGQGKNAYMSQTMHNVDFSKSVYDWGNMIDDYTQYRKPDGTVENEFTDAQANAVAKLMYDCGVSVNMSYAMSASGAMDYDIFKAAAENFKYKSNFFYRNATMGNEFLNLIKEEMDNKRPVLFCGQGSAGGHAYVIDGYDSNDFVHVNWGWGGLSDGFYNMDLMNPDALGTGGGAGGFMYMQSATTFEPDKTGTGVRGQLPLLFLDSLYGNVQYDFSASPKSITKGETMEVTVTPAYNNSRIRFNGNIAVGIYDDTTGKRMAEPSEPAAGQIGAYNAVGAAFNLKDEFKNLPDGTYTLYPISKESRSDITCDWMRLSTTTLIHIKVEGNNISTYIPEPQSYTINLEQQIAMQSNAAVLGESATFRAMLHNDSPSTVSGTVKFMVLNAETNNPVASKSAAFALGANSTGYADVDFSITTTNNRFEAGKKYKLTISEITVDSTNDYTINAPEEYACEFTVVSEEGGVSEVAEGSSVKVYPNPATDVVKVESPAAVKSISLYSTDGKLVKSINGENSINVADCPAGYYIVIIDSESGTTRTPIIKK